MGLMFIQVYTEITVKDLKWKRFQTTQFLFHIFPCVYHADKRFIKSLRRMIKKY